MSFKLAATALHTPGLTGGQKLVLTVIASLSDKSGNSCSSVRAIADLASISIRTVNHHIADLLKLGYLKRTYRSGKPAITRITITGSAS